MRLAAHRTILVVVVVLFALLAHAIAGGPPSGAQDLAPPESFTEEQRGHWAYQTLALAEAPAVKASQRVCNPIDRFILAELERLDWAPAPEADRAALIRRLSFDLTGLPPTPAEVEAFRRDVRPDAYERLVDRLLASPHHGERWGQHWLDLAHYSDSNGFELDAERPDAWRYRDWVVRALSGDLPYDRFLTLQLAGDDLAQGDPDALIATGFCRCGPREVVGGNVIPEVKRQSELAEITGTVGSVFLGLTIGCARCHDHKFDAIPTTDYYRLQAFFAASELIDVSVASSDELSRHRAAEKSVDAMVAPLKKQLANLEAPYRQAIQARKVAMLSAGERTVMGTPPAKRTAAQKRLAQGLEATLRVRWEEVAAAIAPQAGAHAQRERLKREIAMCERNRPRPPAHAMALVDKTSKESDTFVLRRGDAKNRGPKVAPRPPGVILASQYGDAFPTTAIAPTAEKTGRRAALARWLASPKNPLTARVIVNRLWQEHFGRGIVATPSDFGVRGEPPSHPELLDWLAGELIKGGWRLKPIHRLMVTSATYRQSSQVPIAHAADDPDNALLSRMNRRRLDAEGVRDAILQVSGRLNSKMGGPGVLAPLEPEVEDLIFTEAEVVDLWPEDLNPAEHRRRALYLFRKRNVRYPLFDAFDAPDTQSACPQRQTSTHALQALVLLNSGFTNEMAHALTDRIVKEAGDSSAARIQRAFEIVLSRPPTPREAARASEFVAAQGRRIAREAQKASGSTDPAPDLARPEVAEAAAWVDFALALMNSNEFLYVP
jgi:hypothetical protein